MSNFLGHDFRMERKYVFVLWGHIHRCDTDAVNILVIDDLLLALKLEQILVKDLRRQEVGSGGTFEGGANLNHPVHHLCTVFFGYVMQLDWTPLGEVTSLLRFHGVVYELLLLKRLLDVLQIAIVESTGILFLLKHFLELCKLLMFGSARWSTIDNNSDLR